MISSLPHYLPNLTQAQIEDLALKERMVAILPLMAVEQHGPHLPVGTDAILNETWLEILSSQLEDLNIGFVIGAPIVIAKSNEHNAFPGTLSLTPDSLKNTIISNLEQFIDWGFEKVLIFNTHGGNIPVCEQLVNNLTQAGELDLIHLHWYFIPEDASDQTKQYDIHAGQLESSLMYTLAPDLCNPSKADTVWPQNQGKHIDFKDKPVTLGLKTDDISPSGTIGDAAAATQEDGQKWLQAGALALKKRFQEISQHFFFEY